MDKNKETERVKWNGMGWDNRLKMIIMGELEFKNYEQVHF